MGELVEVLRREPQDLLVTDVVVGEADPAAATRTLTEALLALPERTGVILLHPDDDPRTHAALLAAGAIAVLWTGLSDAGLTEALAVLIERRRDEAIARRLAARPGQGLAQPLVSASPAMQQLLTTVRRVAIADTAVLLLGETGVGKERIAALLHGWGPRSRGPFVAVNCAAIPTELFESELFGHERGAFTGALRARRGHFELAHGGTLFLDEIGEVPLPLQAKLLRALQDRRIRPLGATRELDVDVRVIAATNRALRDDVEAGSFRRDLYYRLGVVELEVPALRERPEDVRALTRHYATYYSDRLGRSMGEPDPAALRALEAYSWPGNVRELINVIERAVLLSVGDHIGLDDLPVAIVGAAAGARSVADPLDSPAPVAPVAAAPGTEPPATGPSSSPSSPPSSVAMELPADWLLRPWKDVREDVLSAGERAYLVGILRATGGRIGASARRAGIAERSLFEKMKRHGLRKEDFREPRD
ncbi:MAG: sigma-54-dependent Fis family transcriptional regulator [Myxococcales bacterium]|nr:sigma-54-dependent Fis family transcriptional regulator [Myxococcales bacterium]